MVKVTQVNENENEFDESKKQQFAEDDADYSDTNSEVSDDESDDEDIENETFTDRIVALKDIVPPQYRSQLVSTASNTYNYLSKGLLFGGKALWVVTTSGLLLAVPLALSIVSEQQLLEMEKEMKMQQSTNDVIAPGAEGGFQSPQSVGAGAEKKE